MKITLLLLFIILIVTITFLSMQGNNEGFFDKDAQQASFVTDRLKAFNNVGVSLTASNKVGVLGGTADDILQTVGENKKYPLATRNSEISQIITTCEDVKTMDCGAFDRTAFATNCGICLEMGKGSDGVPKTGGLVLLPEDRANVPRTFPGSIPDYTATIGFCPAARLVSTKEECLKLQRKLLCEKNSSYDLPGCSQCQTDQNYTIVDENTSPGVLAGSGTIKFTGSGTLRIQETGEAPSSIITLSNTPKEYVIQGPESTNIKFFLTASPGQNAWLSGILVGPVTTGTFTTDLRKIVLSDEVTGRKPRASGMTRINGEDATKMAPGFGKTTATIIVVVPFTFTDLEMEESSLCKDAPFVTQKASAEFLGSDPCYMKGSGPGKFNIECLQGAWLANGCTESGKAYPVDIRTAANLMTNSDGKFRTLNEISDYIYNNAIITSTGINEEGVQQSIKNWSEASVFCTGREITSPCDTPSKATGPLSPDCIVYLWNNQGSKKLWNGKSNPIGPTYYTSLAKSLFGVGPDERSCQETGTLSPVNANGSRTANVSYWQAKGGVDAVKSAMADLHRAANAQAAADDTLAPYFKQCYGNITFAARPELRPIPIHIGNSSANTKTVPLPPGVPASWNNIKIVPQGHSDTFVFRKEGSNLIVTRVDSYGGWGANYSGTIESGDMPNIPNVGFVRIEGGNAGINMSQLVVLNEKGQNISRGRPQQVNSEPYSDANKTKANDGGEAPRGHPNQYHGSGGGNDMWQVMLDGASNVSSVIIYNRADCCQDRLASGYVIKLYTPLPSPRLLFTSSSLTPALVQVVKTVNN